MDGVGFIASEENKKHSGLERLSVEAYPCISCSRSRNGSILLMSAMLNGGRTAFIMTPCAFVLLGSLEAVEHSCLTLHVETIVDIVDSGTCPYAASDTATYRLPASTRKNMRKNVSSPDAEVTR